MGFSLLEGQFEALQKIKNGCIVCGGMGSGKSLTALSYYYIRNGGSTDYVKGGDYTWMEKPKQLIIITTARKRDLKEWDKDMAFFLLSSEDIPNMTTKYPKVIVDSWNNIGKYTDVKDVFFIFDEQRVVGKGAWVKSFLKITKSNEWILLSATPGDKWEDYIPVFIANGFYRNRTQFNDEHVIFNPYVKWRSVLKYVNTKKLERYRNQILVPINVQRTTVLHKANIYCEYNIFEYKQVTKYRTHVDSFEPIENASAFCYELRKVVNRDPDRARIIMDILKEHPKAIIFYNFDYELDILRKLNVKCPIAEWNGHKHDPIPVGDAWIYLVQYIAGNEGWNCTTTDTVIFYSQTHSYKMTKQASGRIDRLNTPYVDLYYFYLMSKAPIDISIKRCLDNKKDFNNSNFAKDFKPNKDNELLKQTQPNENKELYFNKKYGDN